MNSNRAECWICCTCWVIGFNLDLILVFDPDVSFVTYHSPVCPSSIILRHQCTIVPFIWFICLGSVGYNEYCKRVHYLRIVVINHHHLYELDFFFPWDWARGFARFSTETFQHHVTDLLCLFQSLWDACCISISTKTFFLLSVAFVFLK